MVEPQSSTTGGGLIVTGSSRGIGAEICRLAAQRGWSVCVNYRNSHDEAAAVVDQIRTSGGVAVAVRADVSVEAEVSTMFDQVEQDLGSVKGLVNNAGVNVAGPVSMTWTQTHLDECSKSMYWVPFCVQSMPSSEWPSAMGVPVG